MVSPVRKNIWKVVLCRKVSYISKLLFISATHLSRRFLRIFKFSSIHRLKLGFLNYFIAPIGLIWFTISNSINLRKSVSDVLYWKCCLEWAANESDFCPFLRRHWTSEKQPSIIFLNECCVLPIYSHNMETMGTLLARW